MRKLSAFIFWITWPAATDRPGGNITYTNNWPHEPLIGNRPTGEYTRAIIDYNEAA